MKMNPLAVAIAVTAALPCSALADDSGKFSGNFNLRYEGVDQDNALKDANAITLRSRLTYVTKSFSGFKFLIEGENSTTINDDFNDSFGSNPDYSVVADPETTELDQLAIMYKNDRFETKLGRQVIALDDQRFVGHVGWRQDRQTFDAFTFKTNFAENFSAYYGYINKRNRIFSDDRDLDSDDHLFNVTGAFANINITGYSYLLSEDEGVERDIDTYGLRANSKFKMADTSFSAEFQFATQDADIVGNNFSADYLAGKLGTTIGCVNLWLAGERLGSDSGSYGFSTPLATLHKFNGWSDQFLGTPAYGLDDINIGAGGKYQGYAWKAVYHDFSSHKAGPGGLGTELNLSLATKLSKKISIGAKYANFNADSGSGRVDTSKVWAWVTLAI